MGIDIHGLNFLRFVRQYKDFGDTITIGRQNVNLKPAKIQTVLGNSKSYKHSAFCESLLKNYFAADIVDSVDNSNYEGASFVHDMNKPLPKKLHGKYDTVIDGGSVEHVYNAPQALWNCSALCREGGQIIHIVPANNFCGHGFWQFSPELFFTLYSEENGYRDTEIFLADLKKRSHWYKVKKPEPGLRVNIESNARVYVMVRTVLQRSAFSHENIQQSDYAEIWSSSGKDAPRQHRNDGTLRVEKKSESLFGKLGYGIRRLRQRLSRSMRMNSRNPNLERFDINLLG